MSTQPLDATYSATRLRVLSIVPQLAVIGGGPAGLRAAEIAASSGVSVTLFDGKPSVGRKFLVAGKGGLNLTHGESQDRFLSRYSGPEMPEGLWESLLRDFDSTALRAWAEGLGVETFQATSGRVYPKAMKAAPLLRRWIDRLRGLGVNFRMNHRWTKLQPGERHLLHFANGESFEADAVVFALGGASWPLTGSDGSWVSPLRDAGVECSPLASANCGWEYDWPPEVLEIAEGMPLKNIQARAGDSLAIGELMVTKYGLEGGAIYQLGAILREMDVPTLVIDFKPTFTVDELVSKISTVKREFLNAAANPWKLSAAARAILARKDYPDARSLAEEVKHCEIQLLRPRAIEEAISSAGGIQWAELDASLMLKRYPGVFAAGEMIDWEAPTGGYLMQGCFATGTRAGAAAASYLSRIGK